MEKKYKYIITLALTLVIAEQAAAYFDVLCEFYLVLKTAFLIVAIVLVVIFLCKNNKSLRKGEKHSENKD